MKSRRDTRTLLERLAGLRPWVVRSYLASTGWAQASEAPHGQLWAPEEFDAFPGERRVLFLPLDPGLRDFAERMGDAVHVLAEVEGRPEHAVLDALGLGIADVFSVRLMPDSPAGTIPLRLGARAVDTIRELVLCAAYEALIPDPPRVQVRPRPREVREALDDVLLTQSGAGSFVLTVRLPVGYDEDDITGGAAGDPADGAQGRRVARALARGVAAAYAAAESALEGGGLAAFAAQAHRGMSAELCAALAKLGCDGGLPFEARFGWALPLPPEVSGDKLPRRVDFPVRFSSVLDEGAKYLREVHSRPDEVLHGPIIALNRAEPDGPGEATIVTVLPVPDGDKAGAPARQRRVRLRLDGPDYERAIEAHRAHQEVSARGVLRSRGKHLDLEDVREFEAFEPLD